MPDSDPSSTTSAHSDRELPADDGGDHCRRPDYNRARTRLSKAADEAASLFSNAVVSHRSPASGVIRSSHFYLKRSGLFHLTALNH
jgi:hypothetical protein